MAIYRIFRERMFEPEAVIWMARAYEGALVALRKKATNGHGAATVRLLNAPRSLQQMVQLMKMETIFPMEMPTPPAASRENLNLAT